jgi:NADH:ubiquinone oxidoreductase subunit 4 (subunit M)
MIALAILAPLAVAVFILIAKEEQVTDRLRFRNAIATISASLIAMIAAIVIQKRFASSYGEAQLKEVWYTFSGAGLNFVFALDGLSMPLFLSTAFLFLIASLFSLNVSRLQVERGGDPLTKQYWAMLLMLESIVLGVFAAYNFIVFFMLWELFLIPIAILIWRFGLEDRKLAASRFFIYTFVS